MKTILRKFSPAIVLAILFLATNAANAFYNPTIGRWINRDPIGEEGGVNLYAFTANSPIDAIDRDGLDTYICNRKLGAKGGDTSRSRHNPFTHTFIFITDENGVSHTFSWGNRADPRGWNFDQTEDIDAAQGALGKGKAGWKGDAAFDRLVIKAFTVLSQAESSRHMNFILFLSCKTEAANLIHQAELYQEMEDED